jgi:hypothetical protein
MAKRASARCIKTSANSDKRKPRRFQLGASKRDTTQKIHSESLWILFWPETCTLYHLLSRHIHQDFAHRVHTVPSTSIHAHIYVYTHVPSLAAIRHKQEQVSGVRHSNGCARSLLRSRSVVSCNSDIGTNPSSLACDSDSTGPMTQ